MDRTIDIANTGSVAVKHGSTGLSVVTAQVDHLLVFELLHPRLQPEMLSGHGVQLLAVLLELFDSQLKGLQTVDEIALPLGRILEQHVSQITLGIDFLECVVGRVDLDLLCIGSRGQNHGQGQ